MTFRCRDYRVVLHPLYRVFLAFLKQTAQSDCRPVYRPWVGDLGGTRSGRTLVQGPPRQAQGPAGESVSWRGRPCSYAFPQGISGGIFNDFYLFR